MATETWVMNASITGQGMFSYPFESNGSRFESIRIAPVTTPSGIVLAVYYGDRAVYSSINGWPIEAYRTITLDDPATGNFLTWLQSNAVKQSTTHGTSKILIDGIGIDLTQDTVAANKMLSGTKAHDANGDVVTGNIPSKAAQTYTPGTSAQTIGAGQYLSGAQTIQGDANLVAGNIKSGVTIFGKTGTLQPAKTEQSKTLTLGASAPTTVTPDSGKVLSSVPVSIDTSVIKAENIAKDVTILGIVGTHEGGGGAETVTVTVTSRYNSRYDDWSSLRVWYSDGTNIKQVNPRAETVTISVAKNSIIFVNSNVAASGSIAGTLPKLFANQYELDLRNPPSDWIGIYFEVYVATGNGAIES